MIIKRIIQIILSLSLIICFSGNSFSEGNNEEGHKKEAFVPGDFILNHIMDSHEWHIAEIGEIEVTVPLPVILISRGGINKGLHIFMSSNFDHGKKSFKKFRLEKEGKYKGKIVEVYFNEKINESVPLPIDLSITKNVLELFIGIALLLWIFISVANAYKRREGKAPKGLQSMMEPIILFVRDDIAKASIGPRYEKYMSFLLTIFFFIFINNLLGLVPIFPGGANLTGNIAVTMVLALFTFIITLFSSNKGFWKHLVLPPGVPVGLLPIMFVIEFMGVFLKPIVLMIRLFANITAGHIIALGFFSLIFIFGNLGGHPNPGAGYGISVLSVAFTVFMSALELLVAFIQAYVFTLLSALYFGMARVDEHHH